jgi:hypothetical protein
LLGDPGSKFLCGKLGKAGRKKKGLQEKEHTRKKREVSEQPSSTAEIR